jgi:hypothetical protein
MAFSQHLATKHTEQIVINAKLHYVALFQDLHHSITLCHVGTIQIWG